MLSYSFYETDPRVMRYAETLVKRGDNVDVVALRRKNLDPVGIVRRVRVFRVQKRPIDEKNRWTYFIRLVRFWLNSALFLTTKYFKEKYKLIHVHNVPDFLVFAAFVPKLFGARIILDIHDIVPEFYANKFRKSKDSLIFKILVFIEKMAIAFSDHVIISNDIWRHKLLSRSVDETKCTTILNYPDESTFSTRAKKEKRNTFIILYPGTLNWHQGLDIAIRAMAIVCKKAPEVELHIYGEGRERPHLEKLCEELKLNDKVRFKNILPQDEIVGVMAQADLGVVPKRNDSFGGEAFSTKILQFMAIGVPVIVSKTKIDSYYFNDSLVQFFKPENEKDLARNILLLIEDKEQRNRLVTNSCKFIESYNWDKNKDKYFTIVNSLAINSTRETTQDPNSPK